MFKNNRSYLLDLKMPDDNGGNAVPAAVAQQDFFRAMVDRLNERRPNLSKPIPVETFKAGADFDQWCQLFTDTVVAVYGLGANEEARLG